MLCSGMRLASVASYPVCLCQQTSCFLSRDPVDTAIQPAYILVALNSANPLGYNQQFQGLGIRLLGRAELVWLADISTRLATIYIAIM